MTNLSLAAAADAAADGDDDDEDGHRVNQHCVLSTFAQSSVLALFVIVSFVVSGKYVSMHT